MCDLPDETGASSDVAAAEEENDDDDDNGSDADDDVEFNDESIGELMNAFDKMGMVFALPVPAPVACSFYTDFWRRVVFY